MWPKLVAFAVSLLPTEAKVSTWPLNGLNHELTNIAGIESRFGQDVGHKAHPRGDFETAFGSLGLKPSTAHWMYKRTPQLQKQFPGLQNETLFLREFWRNPKLYTRCANAHWQFLRASTPTLQRAVYAWRWGLTASKSVSDEEVLSSTYVVKYARLTANDST